jgi:hypothetical protein
LKGLQQNSPFAQFPSIWARVGELLFEPLKKDSVQIFAFDGHHGEQIAAAIDVEAGQDNAPR